MNRVQAALAVETVKITSVDGLATLRMEGSPPEELAQVRTRAAHLLQRIAVEIQPEEDEDLARLLDAAWRDIATSS